jgi:2-oxoglutarate ferredoxin oxidoreductase subunit alpha
MEHMTPVILLTDGNMGQGSQLIRIPKVADLPSITPPIAKANDSEYQPYRRNEKTLARQWAIPGTEGLRHRIGGLEKENGIGNVTMDPLNHQIMVDLREKKVQKVADYIPIQEVKGDQEGDLLVVSWGGTYGTVTSAVDVLIGEGKKVSHAHFKHIMPLPKNTADVFKKFKRIVVCELNSGQFVNYLRMTHPQFQYSQFNKVQGLPFMVDELTTHINKLLTSK